jgi:hypothetical protein
MPMPMPYGMMGAMPVGDALAVPKQMTLPPVCVKCATREGLSQRSETFAWSPPWIFVFFLFGAIGLVIGLIVYFATRKTATLALPICNQCNATWDRGRRNIMILAFGIPVLTVVLSIIVGAIDENLVALPIVLGLLSWLLAPLIYHLAAHRPRTVFSKRVDDTTVHLGGLHHEAAHAAIAASNPAAGGAPPGYGPPPGYGGYGPPPGGGYGPPPGGGYGPPPGGGYGPPPQW